MTDYNIKSVSQDFTLKSNSVYFTQVINQPTRVHVNSLGERTSTCIDHVFTDNVEMLKS